MLNNEALYCMYRPCLSFYIYLVDGVVLMWRCYILFMERNNNPSVTIVDVLINFGPFLGMLQKKHQS